MKIAIGLALLLGSAASGASATISVCGAARAGDELDGRTVRIRGTWREAFPGARLFDELVDPEWPGVEFHVVSSPVSLPYPPPTDYKLDAGSMRRAERVLERAVAGGGNVSATMVGVLYVTKKEDYVPARPLNSSVTIPPHHKWYPLVLLIRSISRLHEQ